MMILYWRWVVIDIGIRSILLWKSILIGDLTVIQVPSNCKSNFSKRVITAINLDTLFYSPSLFCEFSYRNFNNEAKMQACDTVA